MKCIMLGTGHALVRNVYNTCFALEENGSYFLVDTGGGNQILTQLEKANIDIPKIRAIFISHIHVDHILGIFWLVRMIFMYTRMGKMKEPVYVYSHPQCIHSIETIIQELFESQWEFIKNTFILVPVSDLEEATILNHRIQFFDTHAKKDPQYGFNYYYNDQDILTFSGDEPLTRKEIASHSTYLMHEAFCLYSQKDIFHPEKAGHSTALQACLCAQELNIPHVILYHTEDTDIEHRKENYTQEGKGVYTGTIFVPNDLEVIEL